jgi:hypothetical protein
MSLRRFDQETSGAVIKSFFEIIEVIAIRPLMPDTSRGSQRRTIFSSTANTKLFRIFGSDLAHRCPHVVSPRPPNILFGRHPDDVCAAASERALDCCYWCNFLSVTRQISDSDPEEGKRYLAWRRATPSPISGTAMGLSATGGIRRLPERSPTAAGRRDDR